MVHKHKGGYIPNVHQENTSLVNCDRAIFKALQPQCCCHLCYGLFLVMRLSSTLSDTEQHPALPSGAPFCSVLRTRSISRHCQFCHGGQNNLPFFPLRNHWFKWVWCCILEEWIEATYIVTERQTCCTVKIAKQLLYIICYVILFS